jgi:hypothetical protein
MINYMKQLLLILIFLSGTAFLCAQTAAELDGILASRGLTYAQAASLILKAADAAPPSASEEEAFNTAQSRGWLPGKAAAQDPAVLGGTSFIIMKSFGLKGGLLFSIFPGSRYAYREMVYQKIIQGRADPSMAVSGERLLQIISRVLSYTDQDSLLEGEFENE